MPSCKTLRTVLLLAAAMGLAFPAVAQFWVKDSFEKWSEADCRKLLNDSPWAKTHTVGRVFIQSMDEDAAVPGRDQMPTITYVVRLLSALPVRQAIVRLSRLDARYATLPAEQKTEMDARHATLLEEVYADRIVVQVQFSTATPAYRQPLATFWRTQREEELKQEINLVTSRGRIPPARVVVNPQGSDIQIIFPRVVEGQPLIGPGDRNLGVEFQHPSVGVIPSERVYVEFRLRNMMVKNEVLF